MAKLKLTKNELKRQRDALSRFQRYLPTLQLKKQQLQFEIMKVERNISDTEKAIKRLKENITSWVAVFASQIDLNNFLRVEYVKVGMGNIAGIDIPVLEEVVFKEEDYDLLRTPFWLERGIAACKEMITLLANLKVLKAGEEILREELRITAQRVNLFEKIKIPQALENIRVIRIYLGDLQTAEVVRGKIAKAKIEKRRFIAQ